MGSWGNLSIRIIKSALVIIESSPLSNYHCEGQGYAKGTLNSGTLNSGTLNIGTFKVVLKTVVL